MSKTVAVIVAAGNSARMGGFGDKIHADLNGKPVLMYSLEAFQAADSIDEIIVVGSNPGFGVGKLTAVVPGGLDRAQSVRNGVAAISDGSCSFVAVHDGARPLVTPELINRVVWAAKEYGGAIAAIPARDTVKQVCGDFVQATLDRDSIFLAQTPQVFDLQLYRKSSGYATDDSGLIEKLGVKVKIVQGEYTNIKITTPEDLKIAETFLNAKKLCS
jgi:2-C-methyl-D-erythritol 4-phosphate cytidylyltransferase